MIFFNEKMFRKIRIIFDIVNWLWKSNFGTFDPSPLTQFSKFNNFLWVCWFLGKNHSNFVPPVWKLHYSYCHISHGFNEIWYSEKIGGFPLDRCICGFMPNSHKKSWKVSNLKQCLWYQPEEATIFSAANTLPEHLGQRVLSPDSAKIEVVSNGMDLVVALWPWVV